MREFIVSNVNGPAYHLLRADAISRQQDRRGNASKSNDRHPVGQIVISMKGMERGTPVTYRKSDTSGTSVTDDDFFPIYDNRHLLTAAGIFQHLLQFRLV
jgi:hypothetical protein